jgi:hypothetical protein
MNEHDDGAAAGLSVRHPMAMQDPLVDLEFFDRAHGSGRSRGDVLTLAPRWDRRHPDTMAGC